MADDPTTSAATPSAPPPSTAPATPPSHPTSTDGASPSPEATASPAASEPTTPAADAPPPDPATSFDAYLASLSDKKRREVLDSLPTVKKVVDDEANARTSKAFETAERKRERDQARADAKALREKVRAGEVDAVDTVANQWLAAEDRRDLVESPPEELVTELTGTLANHIWETNFGHPGWSKDLTPQQLVDAWSRPGSTFADFAVALADAREDARVKSGQLYRKADVDKLVAANRLSAVGTARGDEPNPDLSGSASSGNGTRTWTREQIGSLSTADWKLHKKTIEQQVNAGLVH